MRKLAAEQQSKLDALDATVERQKKRWDALSPQKRREETESYDPFMQNLAKYPLSFRQVSGESFK